MIPAEKIEAFLHGRDPQKYIVGVEVGYGSTHAALIINDPEKGKHIEYHKFKPFLWFRHDATKLLYGGQRQAILKACERHGVKIKALRTHHDNGTTPDRMANGYKYIATCSKSYNDLVLFFKFGGLDIWSQEHSKLFLTFKPQEQFLMQTGKRLFKGFEDYNQLHRLQFDLETQGLNPKIHRIFQIGIKDNRGFETILEVTGDTPQEIRDSERIAIDKFFRVIDILKPDVIVGHNSEDFDWDFLNGRCERLSVPIDSLAITLDENYPFQRKPAMLKLGGESQPYTQTYMYGYNVIDLSHSIRRAMAINSNIKKWNLKYITKFSKVNKPNRVYIQRGSQIFKIWNDVDNEYALNETTGDWFKITENSELLDGFKIVTGAEIVRRYLADDLWETEKIDFIFNQATFLISKILPTYYQRTSTMGTAGQWKLIMAAWSYENDLAIPMTEPKRDFTGGLSRLLTVGYNKGVVKFDYAALYPKTELTHDIFPELDITGAMKGLLTYVVSTRDEYKFIMESHKKAAEDIKKQLDNSNLTENEIKTLKEKLEFELQQVETFDRKQLPIKILANSWFGSYGAPYLFNWGETNCAEETTCRGRQYLRLMVRHFNGKYNFKPLVGDSVTYDTPVYLRYKSNNNIEVKPIGEIFNVNSDVFDEERLRDFEVKPYQILTINGWKDIQYVYRHKCNKQIYKVSTKYRSVSVTEDHSLFQNGKQIKPSTLQPGDKIDITDLSIYIPDQIKINSDNIVISNEIVEYNDYVYDISTEDGTFVGGIGGINLKNTDGFNFEIPEGIENIKYVAQGNHWKTKDKAGVELSGLDAVLAEFNENYMPGWMGLDIDDIYNATINFSRKNYANLLSSKVKLVGNSIKSKKMPVYIEDFIDMGVKALLEGDGNKFLDLYYDYTEKIFNYKIPIVKIASKSKIKTSIEDYKKKMLTKNKKGNPMPRQAHMELVIQENISVNYDDTIYYVNTGEVKSHGDLKTITDAEGKKTVVLSCKMISTETVENDFETINEIELIDKQITDKGVSDILIKRREELWNSLYTMGYNIAKYLDAFNKKVKPMLICFHPDIRSKILRKVVKDKKIKGLNTLSIRPYFSEQQTKLVSGMPDKGKQQDDLELDLYRMEDSEIRFWMNVNKLPNNITQEEWDVVVNEYQERKSKERSDNIKLEIETIDLILRKLSLSELTRVTQTGSLPLEILVIAEVNDETGMLISRKWGVDLCPISDIWKYENEIYEREEFYRSNNLLDDETSSEDRYNLWLDYKFGKNQTDEVLHVEQSPQTEEDEEVIEEEPDTIFEIDDDFSPELQAADYAATIEKNKDSTGTI